MCYSRNPLNTSPSASARVLPCSKVIIFASSFWNGKREKEPGINSVHYYSFTRRGTRANDRFPYNIILDELLVAQKDLLPGEDGGLGPGLEGSGAGVHSCQHLLLSGFGNASHHFISGLRRRQSRQQVDWEQGLQLLCPNDWPLFQ